MATPPEKTKFLESWIWDAASSIRGAKDAPKYKACVGRSGTGMSPLLCRSSSTTCSTPTRLRLAATAWPRCGNSTRATPSPRAHCSGGFHLRRGYCGQAAIFTPTSTATGPSASHSSRYAYLIVKTTIQADLPPELTARALTFVQEGWASDFNELLADALRRFLESHSARVTEAMVMSDVQWGLRGND